MCASVYSSLLLFTLTTISIYSGTRMATEGLPLVRQERGADDRGLLTGADFLSVLMSSSLRQSYRETTTATTTTATESTTPPTTWQPDVDNSYTRATRSTSVVTSPFAQPELEESSVYDAALSAQLKDLEDSSDSSANDGVVVAVSVSSSVGRTLINKDDAARNIEDTTIREGTTTEFADQNFVASQEHPSIVAEANKSEFSVEESEPITTNTELSGDFLRGYPASVQPLPRQQKPAFSHAPEFTNQNTDKEGAQPLHQTVIYHSNPREPTRARSVSYSAVIQSVPNIHDEKDWEDDKHDRHERHYDNSQTSLANGFQNKPKFNAQSLPTVYGKPEQNYEVDESASVMTNGRVHGIQPSPTVPTKHQETKIGESRKVDDNQKVGYVVEGRNYRKYRVEERTSDGFIVGEYGVVSHDDGSLRGVRYTADGTISPRLIYDALMKFLSL